MAMLLRSLRARLINRGARNYRSYADLAVAYEERVWDSNGTHNRVVRMPSGPAVVITPWNAPFMLSTWKTAPALAAGCTVILKPAEWSPLSCSLLADLTVEAGFPPGVFNVVQGIGEEVGAALVSHPGVRRISFTGSPETARHIGVAAAQNIVPFTGELGGKGPSSCSRTATSRRPRERPPASTTTPARSASPARGCSCRSRSRTRSSSSFTASRTSTSSATRAPTIRPSRPSSTATISRGSLALSSGRGRMATRSSAAATRAERGGLFYEPTLVLPRSNESEIVQREVFGPVLTFQTFADEDEGVALANSTPYGLSGIVYTGSAERAERVGRAVRAGVIWVNTFLVRDLTAPFGGIGISGIGREGGDFALDFYSDLKSIQIADRRRLSFRDKVSQGPVSAPRLVLVLSENWTLTAPRDLRALVDMAAIAEEAGFDAVMISEHIALGPSAGAEGIMGNPRDYAMPGNQDPAMPWPSSIVLLSAIAAATTRLRIAACAVIAPLRIRCCSRVSSARSTWSPRGGSSCSRP